MSPSAGPPSDWVSGERVFAPPTGTFDVDWLVGAVLEAAPGSTPAEARAALLTAWRAIETPVEPAAGSVGELRTGSPEDSAAGPTVGAAAGPTVGAAAGSTVGGSEPDGSLARAARRVAEEARRSFRA